jgi:hypothetical protein
LADNDIEWSDVLMDERMHRRLRTEDAEIDGWFEQYVADGECGD